MVTGIASVSGLSRRASLLAIAAALAVVYTALYAIVGSAMFARAPSQLAIAVTFDLTVTATLIVWWLGVRRGVLPRLAAMLTFALGAFIARRWVPEAPLTALLVVGGAVEMFAAGWLLVRIRHVVRGARAVRRDRPDDGPISALEAGLTAARFPAWFVAIASNELAVVWLAVTGWFRRAPRASQTTTPLAMRGSGWISIASVMGFVIAVESVAAHIAIDRLSPIAAWIATASSAYMLLWLVADAHAIRLYPCTLRDGALHIRIGVRWRATVPLAAITQITQITSVPKGAANLALLEPTVLITTREPIELRALFGIRRRADRIALTIDDPALLVAAAA